MTFIRYYEYPEAVKKLIEEKEAECLSACSDLVVRFCKENRIEIEIKELPLGVKKLKLTNLNASKKKIIEKVNKAISFYESDDGF